MSTFVNASDQLRYFVLSLSIISKEIVTFAWHAKNEVIEFVGTINVTIYYSMIICTHGPTFKGF